MDEDSDFLVSSCWYCNIPMELHWRCKVCFLLLHDLGELKRNRKFSILKLRVGDLCFEHYVQQNNPTKYNQMRSEGLVDPNYYRSISNPDYEPKREV